MPSTDTQSPLYISVLDRLVGFGADSGRNPDANQASGLRELQVAVQRNLVPLLNTRRMQHPIPLEFEQCNASLLVFGLPDFTVLSLRDPGDQRRLGQAIEAAIRTFEPRLSAVSVTPEPRRELDPVLTYRVEAILDIEPAPEPIVFDTVLQADTGKFSVTGLVK